MGLLLSVLVVCVGVLEVIACVRHFQDGYLPLWTPHCAVTSGYAISTERWRKKPSESYEFRSSNDVSESLNHTDDQQSGTYIETSQSVQNGSSGKQQIRDTDYHKSVEDNEIFPSSSEHEKKEAQICDDIFEHERDEVNIINKNIENLSTPANREQDILYEEDCKTQRTTAGNFVTDINSLIPPDDTDTKCSVLTSNNVTHTEISPSIVLEQSKKDQIVQDLIENYPRTISEINVGHEISLSGIDLPQSLSCDVNNEQFLADDSFAGIKHIKQFVADVKSEETLPTTTAEPDIPQTCFTEENISDKSLISNIEIESLTNKEESVIGIPQNNIILDVKDECGIPCSTSIDNQVCQESPEFCSVETSKTVEGIDVEQNVPFSDYKSELEIPPTTGQTFEKIITLDSRQEIPVSSNENILPSLHELNNEKYISSYKQDDFEQRNVQEAFPEDTYVSCGRATTEENPEVNLDIQEDVITEQHAPTETNQSLKEDSVDQFPKIKPTVDLQKETVEEYPNIKADLSLRNNFLDEQNTPSEENLRLRDEVVADQQPIVDDKILKLEDDKIADQHPNIEVGLNFRDDTLAEHSTEQHLNTETNFGLQENVCSEKYPTKEETLSLQKDVTRPQQDIFKQDDEPDPSSFSFENEQQISDTVERIQTDVSESRLDVQTTSTESIIPEKHPHEDISVFDSTVDLSQGDIHKDLTEVQSSFPTSVTPSSTDTSREPATPLSVDTLYRSSMSPPKLPEVQSSFPTSVTPLSTDTSREPATPLTVETSHRSSMSPPKLPDVQSSSLTSVTPLSTDTSREPATPVTIDTSYRSSMSPPKLPSTPRKSKADISWPTFFPGAPVIKRPSVSFATPEAVFTPEDQELLRQYEEESTSLPPCIKKTDDVSIATDSETTTTSTTEDKSTGSAGLSDRSDSFEEDPFPITFKERSPSNIVAGNDFSRKELQLQRKKSYKHKRYSSATEIRSRDEQTEDRSFSEDRKGIVRASSVREARRRHRKPAKASSFEDVLLRDTTEVKEDTCHRKTSAETTGTPIPVGKETDLLETQEKKDAGNEERKKQSEVIDNLMNLSERSESKSLESKPPDDDFKKEETAIEGKNDAKKQDEEEEGDEEDYSVSEEQSSSQQTSPRNEAFWLIFSGEYTKAMSKDWHSGHFCCWQCDESLTGQRYVLRDDHPYCIKCYESVFANVCEECNKTIGIDSKDLSYKDKHWHEACFLCNKCRVSLVDKQFGSKADKIYCGNCYDAQFASRCDGCGEIFRAGTKKMEYKTRQWHEKCFCCCVCKTAIGTKSFIPREQEIYCATCYEEKFATRCVKCNKIITSGGVTYKNEPWHRECFTCTHCNTSLAGQRFTSRDEKPYCAECFGELFAKRCTACSKPITGIGGTRFISFEDRHWHNDCFICATCKTSLVGRGFITDADDIICPECAKQKLM